MLRPNLGQLAGGCGPHRGASLLLLANVRFRQSGVRGDDLHEVVRGVARKDHLMDALPDPDPLFRGLQSGGLFRQVEAAAFCGFLLLMNQSGAEIHHRVVAGLCDGPCGCLTGFELIQEHLLVSPTRYHERGPIS